MEEALQAMCCPETLPSSKGMPSSLSFSLICFLLHFIWTEFNILFFFQPQVILKDVDSLLYVDTDVLFLRPMDDIWKFLQAFNATQLAAMAPEHEIPKIGWYSRFARHPFYGVTGVNSGVMLMNLTRIRSMLFKVKSPVVSKVILILFQLLLLNCLIRALNRYGK